MLSLSRLCRADYLCLNTKKGLLMPARLRFACAITLAAVLGGCGGKQEVKKNEGTIVNTPPTTTGAPSAGVSPGAPGSDQVKLPPTPKDNN